MESIGGVSFYIRHGSLVYYNEKAVRDVGSQLIRSNSNGRAFPVIEFITETVGKSALSSGGFELMAQATEPARDTRAFGNPQFSGYHVYLRVTFGLLSGYLRVTLRLLGGYLGVTVRLPLDYA